MYCYDSSTTREQLQKNKWNVLQLRIINSYYNLLACRHPRPLFLFKKQYRSQFFTRRRSSFVLVSRTDHGGQLRCVVVSVREVRSWGGAVGRYHGSWAGYCVDMCSLWRHMCSCTHPFGFCLPLAVFLKWTCVDFVLLQGSGPSLVLISCAGVRRESYIQFFSGSQGETVNPNGQH